VNFVNFKNEKPIPALLQQNLGVCVCVCVCVCSHLCLSVGLQPEQTAHLGALGVDDPGTHKIGGVGIHPVQQSRAEAYDLYNNNNNNNNNNNFSDCLRRLKAMLTHLTH